MNVQFVAGFGPIVRDAEQSRGFWGGDIGLALAEIAPQYWGTDDLDGVKAFALWPLAQAAESCFGADAWPEEVPAPSTWLELDLESADAVAAAAAELVGRGHRLLNKPTTEPWGQTVARLLSPEGILVGLTYTPWMHEPADEATAPV